MKHLKKKLAWLLALTLIMTSIMPVSAWASDPEWNGAIETTDEYLKEKTENNSDAWSVFARGRNLDADHTDNYYIDYYENLDVDSLNTSGDCAKAVLALRAEGRGNSDKAEAIKEKLLDWDANKDWLIADAYSIPVVIDSISDELLKEENAVEKEGLISSIKSAIESKYDLYGWGEDVDSTAMAAASLTTIGGCETEIEDVLAWISGNQVDDGNIWGVWGTSPETTAQVIVLLSELKKTDDADYTKSGHTTVDGLMSFYDVENIEDGGGFTGGWDPIMRAQQANYALVAYERSKTDGATSLLDFSDVKNVYYVSFDGNGASNIMHTQAIEEGDTDNLIVNTLINNGYRFIEWKDEEGKTYSDQQAITASKDIKLYAIWKKITSDNSENGGPKYYDSDAYYEKLMRVESSNAISGEWRYNEEGKWSFFFDGQQAIGRWVTAINPAAGVNKAGWFYFDEKGEMLTGWQKIKDFDGIERWYYLNPYPGYWYGACYRNAVTPDGYEVDANGVWLESVMNISEDEDTEIQNGNSAGKNSEEKSKKEKKISVSISVDGYTISGSKEVTLNKNASAYDALKAIAKQYGWKISGSGSYVKGIGGEMEKSAGALSGWTYTVNGDTPNKSAGGYKLKDGDSVDWKFVDGPDY